MLGAENAKPLQEDQRRAVNLFLVTRGHIPIEHNQPVQTFSRLEKEGQRYHSSSYTRVTARHTFIVSFVDEKNEVRYGQVQFYVRCGGKDIAVMKLLDSTEVPLLKAHSEEDEASLMLIKRDSWRQ